MATNPEGSRDSGHAGEDAPEPRVAAVVVEHTGPAAAAAREPTVEDDLAEAYEAALEGHNPTHFSIDLGHTSTEDPDFDGQPTSADGEPRPDSEQDPAEGRRKGGAPKRDQLFGQVLADRYRILDLIGKGGMGKVYLAEHVALGKKVAVKVLNPAYTNRPDQVKRFLREAQAASSIEHENVIDITDFGEMPNGQVFFAMEYLQGEDLGKLLKKSGQMPWARARRVMLQICRALQAAHASGIIHRDMKPENCFLIHRNGIRDFIKVLDFGIAKFLEEHRDSGANPLTQVGALIGTPEYMAPEQIHGDPADLRMDVYAVGCILYQLVTGNLPFTDKTMYGVLSQQVNARPVPPRQLAPEADIPVEVEALILRAMEKDKALRFQTMGELIEAIVAAPRGGPATTNLEAAASAVRRAVGSATPAPPAPFGPANPVTPIDSALFASGQRLGIQDSASGLRPTTVAPPWRAMVMDPRTLTRLVIGLGAAVLVLLLGLVCALSRGGEPELPVAAAEPEAEAPPVNNPPEPEPPRPERPVEDETFIVEDSEAKAPAKAPKAEPKVEPKVEPKAEPKAEPKKTTPVKKSEAAPKAEPSTANWPEVLGPVERSQALKNYRASFMSCRTISTPKGKTYKLRLKVDGPKGRVTEATPDDASAEGKCLARVFKNKVRFVNSRKQAQEFPIVVQL